MSKRRTHSPEFKARVAMEAISGRARKKEAADLTVQSTEQQELFKSDLRKRSVAASRGVV